MNDSEETKQEQAQAEQKSIVPAVVHNSKSSGTRTLSRDATSGRFAKSAKKREQDLAKSERSQDRLRELLSKPREGKKKPLEIELAEKLSENILNSTNEDLSGAAKAYEILQTRAWGKPAPSEQEKAVLTTSGIRVVIVGISDSVPKMTEEEAKRKPRLKPAWVTPESVETNPGSGQDQVDTKELQNDPSSKP